MPMHVLAVCGVIMRSPGNEFHGLRLWQRNNYHDNVITSLYTRTTGKRLAYRTKRMNISSYNYFRSLICSKDVWH